MADQPKQTVITLQDIRDNKYTFGKDVITEHKTGVSQSRASKAENGGSESNFKARYHYQGSSLTQVMGHADYQLGVNLRASLRGTGSKPAWIPPNNTAVDVFVTNQGKVNVSDLPAEAQIEYYFGNIEDPAVRKKAKAAFRAAL